MSKLAHLEAPPARPDTVYQTAAGETLSLAELEGRIVLVNAWATWCAPCLAEMPSLNHLQALRGGENFQVVTISIDRSPEEAAAFFKTHQLDALQPWHDGSYTLPGDLALMGYPTSVFYDRHGREVARLAGDAVWDSQEALALVDHLIGAGHYFLRRD